MVLMSPTIRIAEENSMRLLRKQLD
jgi:hypothetical protein